MTPETVDKMLAEYNRCVARHDHILAELDMAKRQIEESMRTAMTDEALTGIQYDGMPHGSGVSNPTESIVVKYLSGYVPRYIKEMQIDAEKLRDELEEANTVILYVGAWMKALNERESFVVKAHVMDHRFWADILIEYQSRWGVFSKEGLRRLKKRALDKIYDIAQ